MTTFAPSSAGSVETTTRRRSLTWARLRFVAGLAILGLLVWRLGAGPFVDGLKLVNAPSLAAALVIGLVTTTCCAWRWRLVGRGLGVEVPLRFAITSYYRSQFLNSTLPGGILGDVHRAVHHGRSTGSLGVSARAVAWERTAGQAVQIALTLLVLLVLPSPVRSAMPAIVAALIVLVLGIVLISRMAGGGRSSRITRVVRTIGSDLRDGLLSNRAWPGIVAASMVIVCGHAAVFLIAIRTVGLDATPTRMLPIVLLVMLAMTLPLSVGGWGPREGVAAWAFAMAGLTAAQGVTAAVVYGVISLVACLPGAVVLTWDVLHPAPANPDDGARG
jgi:uncharacterized membrane protein YbhN (UPF0104 family)